LPHALLHAGGQLGTIIALITAPLIIKAFGWPAVFEVYGALGLLWMLLWQPLVADYPPLIPQWKKSTPTAAAAAAPQSAGPKEQQQLPVPEGAHDYPGGTLSSSNGNGSSSDRISSGSRASSSGREQLELAAAAAADRGKTGTSSSSMPQLLDVPWKSFFTNKPFLALIMAHASFGELVVSRGARGSLPAWANTELGSHGHGLAALNVAAVKHIIAKSGDYGSVVADMLWWMLCYVSLGLDQLCADSHAGMEVA
jgi:hypothetical protein